MALVLKQGSRLDPNGWKPTITLDTKQLLKVQLVTKEINALDLGLEFILESEYAVKSICPRSYFALFKTLKHTFVFDMPDHKWFKELAGLRKVLF